jgi:hypothetical protein
VIGGLLAVSLVLFVLAGVNMHGRKSEKRPAEGSKPAEVVAGVATVAPKASRPGSEVARDLLTSVPPNVSIDDLRISWPGPEFALRGHENQASGSNERLLVWQKRLQHECTTRNPDYQAWFKRLDQSEGEGQTTFELIVAPENPRPASSPLELLTGVTSTDKTRAKIPLVQAGLTRELTDAADGCGTHVIELNSRPGAFASARYGGDPSLLLDTLGSLERRRLPLKRIWFGPWDGDSEAATLLVELENPRTR